MDRSLLEAALLRLENGRAKVDNQIAGVQAQQLLASAGDAAGSDLDRILAVKTHNA